jgi:hypothetical protein
MTRKDFVLIARVLNSCSLNTMTRYALAHSFADALATTNPNFDRGRFINAVMRTNEKDM